MSISFDTIIILYAIFLNSGLVTVIFWDISKGNKDAKDFLGFLFSFNFLLFLLPLMLILIVTNFFL